MSWIEASESPVGIFCNVSKLSSVSIINFFLVNWLGKNCINVLLSFFQIENNTITYQTYKQILRKYINQNYWRASRFSYESNFVFTIYIKDIETISLVGSDLV